MAVAIAGGTFSIAWVISIVLVFTIGWSRSLMPVVVATQDDDAPETQGMNKHDRCANSFKRSSPDNIGIEEEDPYLNPEPSTSSGVRRQLSSIEEEEIEQARIQSRQSKKNHQE